MSQSHLFSKWFIFATILIQKSLSQVWKFWKFCFEFMKQEHNLRMVPPRVDAGVSRRTLRSAVRTHGKRLTSHASKFIFSVDALNNILKDNHTAKKMRSSRNSNMTENWTHSFFSFQQTEKTEHCSCECYETRIRFFRHDDPACCSKECEVF